jgi:hypothetical protein
VKKCGTENAYKGRGGKEKTKGESDERADKGRGNSKEGSEHKGVTAYRARTGE